MKLSRSEDAGYYLCMPDGTIVYEPTEEDYELWRDEARDLLPEQPEG